MRMIFMSEQVMNGCGELPIPNENNGNYGYYSYIQPALI